MYIIFIMSIILSLDSFDFAFILFGPIIMNFLCSRFIIYVNLLKSHFIDSYTILSKINFSSLFCTVTEEGLRDRKL